MCPSSPMPSNVTSKMGGRSRVRLHHRSASALLHRRPPPAPVTGLSSVSREYFCGQLEFAKGRRHTPSDNYCRDHHPARALVAPEPIHAVPREPRCDNGRGEAFVEDLEVWNPPDKQTANSRSLAWARAHSHSATSCASTSGSSKVRRSVDAATSIIELHPHSRYAVSNSRDGRRIVIRAEYRRSRDYGVRARFDCSRGILRVLSAVNLDPGIKHLQLAHPPQTADFRPTTRHPASMSSARLNKVASPIMQS